MEKNFSTKELGFTAPQNEQIEMALTYDFSSIDIDLNEFGRQVTSRGEETARRLLDSAEKSAENRETTFGIGTFRLPFSVNEDEAMYKSDMQRLPALARAAADINATRCIARIQPFSATLSMQENFELHRTRLAEIAAVLGECGIKLGVEFVAPASARKDKPHEFIHTFDEMVSLVAGISNIGVVVDVFQLYASGVGVEVLDKINVNDIVCVRLGDAPADVAVADLTLKNCLLPAETGTIDSGAFVKRLEELGYEGPVTPMCDGSNFRGERRDLIAEMAGLRMKKVWIAAGLTPPEPESAYPVPEQKYDESNNADGEGEADSETAETETEAANA